MVTRKPRRLAARSVARRLAEELGTCVGEGVALKVRFTDQSKPSSWVKLMTDGILLAETQRDPLFGQYEVLIIDEAHERNLNIDFLLGYIKRILPKRPELKLIITSATIDAKLFSDHFNQAPVLEVSGRTYPVSIHYQPLSLLDEDDRDMEMEEAVVESVESLRREGSGDILVFLPGEREIHETARILKENPALRDNDILPLFARLNERDQKKIFQKSQRRRVILSTNVAETSLTVPGIRYVVDSGLARVKRYNPRAKLEQLHIEKISQDAAQQRAGRCGRLGPGVCIRLYDEDDFHKRPPFTDPEILRSNLASVMLRMAALHLGDVHQFPFLQKPLTRQLSDGLQTLQDLGALDRQQNLTTLGKDLARLPVDPRIARWLLAGQQHGCLASMLVLASGLSIQDPREWPFDHREAAEQCHRRWGHGPTCRSDFMLLLKLWKGIEEVWAQKSLRQRLAWSHQHFLSHIRIQEWRDLHQQLSEICQELGWNIASSIEDYETLHRCLLTGLLSQIAYLNPESLHGEYIAPRGLRVTIHPRSCLKKKKPQWLMAAEWVDTRRPFARTVGEIDAKWFEQVAKHLIRYRHTGPRFDVKRGEVVSTANMSLHGLNIGKKTMSYTHVDPQQSRIVFIRQALVEDLYPQKQARFFLHNREIFDEIEDLEHKTRQNWLDWDDILFSFYESVVPDDCVDLVSFNAWAETHQDILCISKDCILKNQDMSKIDEQFPEDMFLGQKVLGLRYRFDPQHPMDGMTIECPLSFLNRLSPERMEWLVPGMIREKIHALIKGLPKEQRRLFMPIEGTITRFLSSNISPEESLYEQLAQWLTQENAHQVKIYPEFFRQMELPRYLRCGVDLLSETGESLAYDRDLSTLQQTWQEQARLSFREDHTDEYERIGIMHWDFGTLPEHVDTHQGVQAYPALSVVEDQHTLAIRLFDQKIYADSQHKQGILMLLSWELKEQLKQIQKKWPEIRQAQLIWRSYHQLVQDAIWMLLEQAAFGIDDTIPRDESSFSMLQQHTRKELPECLYIFNKNLPDVCESYQRLSRLRESNHPTHQSAIRWLDTLFMPGFLHELPWVYWLRYPYYLRAQNVRCEKFLNQQEKDKLYEHQYQSLLDAWHELRDIFEKRGIHHTDSLLDFRWQCEELRISLWAQELKTPRPVSTKRLEKEWHTQEWHQLVPWPL